MTVTAPAGSESPTATKVYRVAVIGCGVVSGMHFTGYLAHPERIEIVAACDPVEERLSEVRQRYGIESTYTSIDDLLKFVDFDVAVVCTPTHVRLETVTRLVRAGKHVFVEKPLAETLREAENVVGAADDAGVKLAVDQNFRHHYAFGLARSLILNGKIGRLIGISHQDLTFRQDKGWRTLADRHALSVMGIHWFDGFRHLLPGQDATWINSRTYSSPAVESAGETDAFIEILFGDVPVSYVQSFSSRFEVTETFVFGNEGTIRLGYEVAELRRHDGETILLENPNAGNGKPESAYLGLSSLLTAIDDGSEPSNSGHDNLKTVGLLDAAYQSARHGEPLILIGGTI